MRVALVPALRERAAEAAAERRLPDATIADFQRLELARCLQPVMFGGYGSDYRVFTRIIRTLAQGCGSTAWVYAVFGEHNWLIGMFPEEAQHAVWGENPRALTASSFTPTGEAVTVRGRLPARRQMVVRQRLRPRPLADARRLRRRRPGAGARVPGTHARRHGDRRLERARAFRHRQQERRAARRSWCRRRIRSRRAR